ncbi:MAG TPA: MFS transporter, partial [Chitinophagales bacterium]|nr:MFS transporter [Chitinophagales bacterium]
MTTPHDALAAVRNRNFRRFLSYRFLFTFAVQMEATVVAWIIYQLTGDPLSLGLIGLAEAVPYLCTSLIGGYAADRIERKKIALAATSMFTMGSVLFYAAALFPEALPATRPWCYYTIIFTTGIARGFLAPSVTAMFAQVLPRELYANGAAWNTNTWQTAAVAGPAAGGLMLGWFSNTTAFGIVLGFSVASLIVLSLLPRYTL